MTTIRIAPSTDRSVWAFIPSRNGPASGTAPVTQGSPLVIQSNLRARRWRARSRNSPACQRGHHRPFEEPPLVHRHLLAGFY